MTLRPGEIIVDSFAGGGGASLGISWALGRGPDVAINHDKEAIALHKANHPESTHFSEDVWKVDPVEACAGRPVGLMWLSPDCKHFSKAKGGKPVTKKVRGLAWIAIRWATAVRPRVIALENVEEFQGWGPVLADGTPCPVRKGKTFRAFVAKLRRLGYAVEWKELRACDYGAPTIRKRLFLVARCDGEPIQWPAPTHGKGREKPYRTAGDCINWSLPCPSIFGRKRPLADATNARIARGLRKFVIEAPKPFIVNMAHGGKIEPLDLPISTIATERGGCRAVVVPSVQRVGEPKPQPFIVGVGGRMGQSPERGMDTPYHTITSKADSAIVVPTLIQTGYGEREGQAPRSLDIEKPLGTVVAGGVKHALVTSFLAKHYGQRHPGEVQGATLFEPAPTVTTIDHTALVASSLVKLRGTSKQGQSMDEPLHTISAGGLHHAEVRAFLVAYYGNEKEARDLFNPLGTVTTKERHALVQVGQEQYVIADIGMRMLAPRELYRAQGFPDSYNIDIKYEGKPMTQQAQVRMCGNSVCPPMAECIVRANFAGGVQQAVTAEVAA